MWILCTNSVLHVLVIHYTIFTGRTVLASKCDNEKEEEKENCLYKNLPQSIHLQSLFILRHTLSTDKAASILDCGDMCIANTASLSCAYDTSDNTCFVFNIGFDDTAIALQLHFGWRHIYIKDNGIFVIRDSSFPCDHDYCIDTCLPGYTEKCFNDFKPPDCEKEAVYESCQAFIDRKPYGRNVNIEHTYQPFQLDINGVLIPQMCWVSEDLQAKSRILPSIEYGVLQQQHIHADRMSHHGVYFTFHLQFSVSDDVIETWKSSCTHFITHKINIVFKKVNQNYVYLVGWNGDVKKIKDVPNCEACSSYKDNSEYNVDLHISNDQFVPVREIRVGDVNGNDESAALINYYLFCTE